jgi:hypothetical protein
LIAIIGVLGGMEMSDRGKVEQRSSYLTTDGDTRLPCKGVDAGNIDCAVALSRMQQPGADHSQATVKTSPRCHQVLTEEGSRLFAPAFIHHWREQAAGSSLGGRWRFRPKLSRVVSRIQ